MSEGLACCSAEHQLLVHFGDAYKLPAPVTAPRPARSYLRLLTRTGTPPLRMAEGGNQGSCRLSRTNRPPLPGIESLEAA